jgi:hypothetical protein
MARPNLIPRASARRVSFGNRGPLARAVVPIVLAVAIGTPAWWIARSAARQYASADWAVAPGVVQTSHILAGGGKTNRIMHGYELRYVYDLGEQRHVSTAVTTLGTASVWLRGGPHYFAKRYQAGDTLRVRIDPENPERAIVEAGLERSEAVAAGLAVLALGGLSVLFAGSAIGTLLTPIRARLAAQPRVMQARTSLERVMVKQGGGVPGAAKRTPLSKLSTKELLAANAARLRRVR